MRFPKDPIAIVVIIIFIALVVFLILRLIWRILRHVASIYLARRHALKSIPLPRQSTLISGSPESHIEAVCLDVVDTEYRRTVDGNPRYERYSAEEIAELRVFLFERAFRRKGPRILYEIEVGVPLHRKLEEGDPDVCAWALKRLKANPPLFGKADSIDDLVYKPNRFRHFLWTHGIGSSAVLFLDNLFRELPLSIVPRAVRLARSAAESASASKQLHGPPAAPEERSAPANPEGGDIELPGTGDDTDATGGGDEHLEDLVATLDGSVLKTLETGDDSEATASIADARAAVSKASPHRQPDAVREFLVRLDVYQERLASFEAAFTAEASKPLDDWSPWLRDALAAATAGGSLAELGEDAMVVAFRRHARRIYVTSAAEVSVDQKYGTVASVTVAQNFSAVATVAVARGARTATGYQRPESQTGKDGTPTIETEGEVVDSPGTPRVIPSKHNTDQGSEIGF